MGSSPEFVSRGTVEGSHHGERQRSEASIGFGEAISAGFSNYFNFNERSTRSAYWYFVLFLAILGAVTGILDFAIFGPQIVGPLTGIASLATFIPTISLSVRRLHDISRTGWWVLLALIPIVGWIILIVWACQPTIPQANEYGPPPAA
jgi:uncharacterized membrane protein YhaH (DUF805 family)